MSGTTTDIGTSMLDDDSGVGQAMFAIFIAACLLVTGVIAMMALINTWWLLWLAFAVHVVLSTTVGAVVFRVLSGGGLMRPADQGR